jgi:hypothetical protein
MTCELDQAQQTTSLCRVRVWFAGEVICSHVAEAERAKRYAVLIVQRFAGLRVTIDPEPARHELAASADPTRRPVR